MRARSLVKAPPRRSSPGRALRGGARGGSVCRAGMLVALCAVFVSYAKRAACVEVVRPRVVRVLPHDSAAFTQGLLWFEGQFLESTGQYGRSTLRRVDPETGHVEQRHALASTVFGEGLARVDRQLIQLTWRSGVAYRYELDTFEQVASYQYDTEGWGLCFDGQRLVMSDGSSRLSFREPSSFEVVDSIEVTLNGAAVARLNELECVARRVYANVWQTERIVVIDPASGRVEVEIDASGLLTEQEARRADVLNGIAHRPDTGRFYLTGKYWPKVFEVELPLSEEQEAAAAQVEAPSSAMAGAAASGVASRSPAEDSSSALRVRRGTSSCACASRDLGSNRTLPTLAFPGWLASLLFWSRWRRRARRGNLAGREGAGSH